MKARRLALIHLIPPTPRSGTQKTRGLAIEDW